MPLTLNITPLLFCKDDRYVQKPEVEETNEVETPQVTEDKHVWVQERVTKLTKERKPSATTYMSERASLSPEFWGGLGFQIVE